MKILLKTNGLFTFLILFSPFIFTVIGMMTIVNTIGLKNNNVIMYLGPIYVYPQVFILTWWSKFISENINKQLDQTYKLDLKGLVTRYKWAKWILITIFGFSYVSIIIAHNTKLDDQMNTVFIGLGIVLNIAQVLVFINVFLGFIKMNKIINQGLRAINNKNLDTIVTYLFLPLTLGSIQKNIKLILKELKNNGIQHGI